MRTVPLQSEAIFATELTKLVHSHAGCMRSGQRAFWLMAAAIQTLNDEAPSAVFRSGVQQVAGLVYDKVARYMPL